MMEECYSFLPLRGMRQKNGKKQRNQGQRETISTGKTYYKWGIYQENLPKKGGNFIEKSYRYRIVAIRRNETERIPYTSLGVGGVSESTLKSVLKLRWNNEMANTNQVK